MKRNPIQKIRKIPRKILVTASLVTVLLTGIGLGAITGNQITNKPTTTTIIIQDSQIRTNSITIAWDLNSLGLNLTNTGPATTAQAQITFYNGTNPNSLGTQFYNLNYNQGETRTVYVGGWSFQLLDLTTGSRILIRI